MNITKAKQVHEKINELNYYKNLKEKILFCDEAELGYIKPGYQGTGPSYEFNVKLDLKTPIINNMRVFVDAMILRLETEIISL